MVTKRVQKNTALRQRLSNYQIKKNQKVRQTRNRDTDRDRDREDRRHPADRQTNKVYINRIIKVTGLNKKITNHELLELFSDIGWLTKCCIDFDSLGRSKGTASIKYKDSNHAIKAIRKFHSILLFFILFFFRC